MPFWGNGCRDPWLLDCALNLSRPGTSASLQAGKPTSRNGSHTEREPEFKSCSWPNRVPFLNFTVSQNEGIMTD